ncbi:MAG: hypothetical protein IPM57_00535 [Oligoflexia bacterium]|nr:hypothetical protein [Oligoflexia bacterium]
MASAFKVSAGQSIIELTIVLSLVLFIILSSVKVLNLANKKFKHQSAFLDSKPIYADFELKLSHDVFFFETKRTYKNILQMENEGWLKTDKRILQKEGKYIFINGNLGVLYD